MVRSGGAALTADDPVSELRHADTTIVVGIGGLELGRHIRDAVAPVMARRGRRVAVEGEESHEVLELEKIDAILRAGGGRKGGEGGRGMDARRARGQGRPEYL